MLPFQCYLCHSQKTTRLLCSPCHQTLAQLQISQHCQRCGTPDTHSPCGQCIKHPPAFDGVIAPYHYTFPLDALIKKFKYGNAYHFSAFLSSLLPAPPAADYIIPMPLHPKREQQRGFNQSRELCKALRMDYTEEHLQRVKDTEQQVNLPNKRARQDNVKDAFRASIDVFNKTILLVDDIVTSGSTVQEASRTLKKAGAQAVIIFAIARASQH